MRNTNKSKIKAIDKDHLVKLIKEEIKINGYKCDLNFIDTSDITDMSHLFCESDFNGNISQWNTSNVISMWQMFYLSSFNGDINNWNTSKVINMYQMFTSSNFNGDINNWNTFKVNSMYGMFESSEFNKDISNWNTSNVVNMSSMFYKSEFNGDISNWDIQNVRNIKMIFKSSKSINVPYWAKIEDNNERIKAYQAYNAKKEKDLILNKINENIDKNIKINKDIIKI